VSDAVSRRVASNTAVQLAGKGAVLLAAAGSIAILTRYLGPGDYGRFTLALMYVQLFGVLADVGLYMTVVRDISKRPEETEELVGNTLVLRGALSFGAIALAGLVSLVLPYEADVRLAILLAGGPLLFGLLNSSLVAVFQAQLRMSRAVISEVVGRIAGLALTAGVALLDLGFYAVMGAAAGGALVSLVVTWLLVRGLVRVRLLANLAVWRRLLVASVPLGLALAMNELYFRADTLIISIYRDYEDVGEYTLAFRMLEFTLPLGTVFLTTLFPVMSRDAAGDPRRAAATIQGAWDVMVALALPLAAGGALLAPEIVDVIGGADFDGSVTPLRILLVAGGLALVNGIFGLALIARERQLAALWLNVAALVFNVGLNLALVPAYGIVAAAIVTVASEILILAGSYPLMRRHLGFFPSPGTLGAALGASAVMAGVLLPVRDAPLAVSLPLGVAVYAAVLYAVSPRARAALAGLRR
jgi:O-antigen/teichoic acid export membrane protein